MRCLASGLAALLFLLNPQSITVAAQDYPIAPVPFTSVTLRDSFWTLRLETNRAATVEACFRRCEETGRIDNFAKAGKLKPGEFRGIRYDDSDVFKVIEGASYALALRPDPALDSYLDDLIAKIAAAQEPDGYLYTCRTINPEKLPRDTGKERWSFLQHSHELYNVGHMYEAACAHFQATGKRTLLDVALKNAALIEWVFGPGKRGDVPGHQEIEIGLVRLYRMTGDKKHLDMARFFIDQRGRPETHKLYGEYAQDHKPVVEQTEPTGHAVRAGYLYSAMADVAAITGDQAYVHALGQIWTNLVSKKLYLTGGMGAEAGHEGFGPDFFLPNKTAYNETCAAVALGLWNHRMFLLTGEAKYIDILERVAYNGFLSGVSLRGDTFFYPNPLSCDGKHKFNHGSLERSPWFGTACCPVNVVRFLPSLAGFVYANRNDAAYVNLYAGGEGRLRIGDIPVTIRQQTLYPWDGKVRLAIVPEQEKEFALHLRIPGWTGSAPLPGGLYQYLDAPEEKLRLRLNGRNVKIENQHGYAVLRRKWRKGDVVELVLPMQPRRVQADPRVQADAGLVAIERGPLVYCFEGADNGGTTSNIRISSKPKLETVFRGDLLGGVSVIKARGKTGEAIAIPYYAWDHRGAGEMDVWVPRERSK
jgi:uncharacterized protein